MIGLVHVYTGDGKGKTTAAIGQGLRSAGRGLKVYMVQFLKTADTGELYSTKMLEGRFSVYRFESPRGFFWTLSDEQKYALKQEVQQALSFVRGVMEREECDVLILDEIMGAMHNQLTAQEEVCALLNKKPTAMEVILTGRNAPDCIVQLADYVSEIRAIKHPMSRGVEAREGIEY